jgi:hypothetical protein
VRWQHRWIVDGMNAAEAKARGQQFAALVDRWIGRP